MEYALEVRMSMTSIWGGGQNRRAKKRKPAGNISIQHVILSCHNSHLRDWQMASGGMAIDPSYALRFSDLIAVPLAAHNSAALHQYCKLEEEALRGC
jgi:hypothetical protein